jgi:hypothetical protein
MTLTAGTRTIPLDVVEYLGRHHVITVSTPSFTGMPHADTVVYVNDLSTLYFHVLDGSVLARNIRDSKYVSFTIDDYTPQWSKLRELQGVGLGSVSEPMDAPAVAAMFATKFGETFSLPPGRLHSLAPIEMHFVDYQDGDVPFERPSTVATPAPVSRLRSIPTPTDLDRLLFEPGEMIFRPNGRSGSAYILLEGTVELRREGFGADQTVVRIGPGQMFEDDGQARRAGRLVAEAVERCVVLRVESSR